MAQNYGANNIDSLESHICTASVVYHFCSENRLFKILPKKPAQIANLKNPDLDVIRRIHPECRFYGLTIRWIFPPKRTHIFIKKSYNVKRRRQQGRKKSSGHISKTTIFARASRFFLLYDVKQRILLFVFLFVFFFRDVTKTVNGDRGTAMGKGKMKNGNKT